MPTKRRCKPIGTIVLRPEPLEARRLLATGASAALADVIADVGAAEQAFVYELNRARHDPVAYQNEQGLSVDLSYVTPRAPLALSSSLAGSSGFHAEEMASNNYFAHQSQVTGDWPNRMARDHGYILPASWEDDANYIESLAAGYGTPLEALGGLIVDEGVPLLGHRNHLLGIDEFSADNREIGVGYAYNASATYQNYWAIHATRSDAADTFLTGVVFNDSDSDARYDSGEGLAGVTVTAGQYTTTTNTAGGWSLGVSSGAYTVTASGAGFDGTGTGSVTVAGSNVEVDFISGRSWGIVDFEDTGPPPTAQPLGTVDLLEIADQDPTGGELWYRAESTRQGLFTLEAFYDAAGGNAEIALYDAALGPVGTATAADGSLRIDARADAAAEVFYFRLTGTNAAVDLRIANLVNISPDGTQVTLHGTAGDDSCEVTIGSGIVVVIDGVSYEARLATGVEFIGGGGSDAVTVNASAGDDLAALSPTSGTVTGPGYQIAFSGVASAMIYGGGGNDEADLVDSAGDDRFVGSPTYAALQGDGFSNRLWNFAEVRAESTAGGVDVGKLYDSPGNDSYVATPTYNAVSGDGFHNRIRYFEGVHAYATAGGVDVAKFYDSPGDDNFVATPTYAALYADGFFNRAKFFEAIHAYATAGGVDLARLYDSAGNDQLVATATYAALYGDGFFNRISFFEGVHAYATAGGVDVARFYDSAADDVFYADPDQAALFSSGVYYNRAKFFEGVHAYATAGGRDVARLVGSDAGSPQHSDKFHADPTQAALFGTSSRNTGFYNRAKYFEEVYADANSGGSDEAYFHDSAFADLLQARGNWARLSNAAVDFFFQATGFDSVRATATSSGNTTDVILPLSFELQLEGSWRPLAS